MQSISGSAEQAPSGYVLQGEYLDDAQAVDQRAHRQAVAGHAEEGAHLALGIALPTPVEDQTSETRKPSPFEPIFSIVLP